MRSLTRHVFAWFLSHLPRETQGTYRLTRALRFTAEDSGSVWRASEPGNAVISGGVPVVGWRAAEGERC